MTTTVMERNLNPEGRPVSAHVAMNPFLRVLYFVTICQLFGTGWLQAMPPLQHRVPGVIQRFDLQTRTLTVAPAKSELPSTFIIKEGRTRLRQDGQKAAIEQLPATGPVTIYYKTELGQRVATEVSWRTENSKSRNNTR